MEDIVHLIGGIYEYQEAPKILTKVKRGNFSKIMSLGWEPTITLEEGIEELKQWHQSYQL
jgi:nucleoside-diphosphate-sugar epimerase